MSLDERLEALVHSVELNQTVELVATLHRENEQRMTQMMEAIGRLAHIADIQ